MKQIIRSSMLVAAIAALLGLGAGEAHAQLNVNQVVTLTNLPTQVTTQVASNITHGAIALRKNQGMAVIMHFGSTNAATAAVKLAWQLSADGTNWATDPVITSGFALTGTTGVRGWTNFQADAIGNMRWIRPLFITNAHTATAFITNVQYSVFN